MSQPSPNQARKILVSSALPYANGSIHMGHMVEYIQTDIWVRFQKLVGNDCIYVCASDAHGTPIMLKAREMGISPEELTETNSKEFVSVFEAFGVVFDNYHTTHSPENEALVVEMFEALRESGDIYTKTIEQAYELEYGQAVMELHEDAIAPGERVLLVDDLLATGGTMEACCRLIQRARANVVACAFVVELVALGGRNRIAPYESVSLVRYD